MGKKSDARDALLQSLNAKIDALAAGMKSALARLAEVAMPAPAPAPATKPGRKAAPRKAAPKAKRTSVQAKAKAPRAKEVAPVVAPAPTQTEVPPTSIKVAGRTTDGEELPREQSENMTLRVGARARKGSQAKS